MEFNEQEEKLLRSVALQNAKAVLLARERVERELLQTQQALRASNRRVTAILESIGDGFFALDHDWRFSYLNAKGEELLKPIRRTSEPLLGRNFWEEFPETLGTPIEENYRRAVREGITVAFETYCQPFDAWFDVRAYPSEDGLSIYLHDATQRRGSEEALRKSEERFRATFNQAAVGIAIATLHGRFEEVNDRFTQILGYSREELFRRTFLEITHPDDLGETRANVEGLLAGRVADYVYEKRYLRKDQSIIWSCSSVTLLKDADGRPLQFIGVIEDITERKRTEERLRQAQEKLSRHTEELERQIAERTASLRETIGELEAFSYSISHDLRAPLRAMQGYADALLHDYRDKLDPEAAHFLDRIHRGAARLDLLIQDVLAYSKVAKGEVCLQRVDLKKVIDEVVETSPRLQAPNLDLRISGPLPAVLGHEGFLSQCVSNLLGNAIKFIAPGTLPVVRISADRQDGMVRLWFADNGIGIPPEYHQGIFQIFGRVHPDRLYEGTGIGLAIVKKAIERLGGKVGVVSDLGKGSSFWITLQPAP